MIFNEEVIRRKSEALDVLASRAVPDIAADLSKLFGDVADLRLIQRSWYPGGGALLLAAVIDGERVFIKVKDKTLFVESRLECEKRFSAKGALNNEATFCSLLADDPNVSKLKAYREDSTYSYAVFECLDSFTKGIQHFDAHGRYLVFRQIEALVRRLYENGIVHTDVHENNVVFRGRTPVLCDFEEARLLVQQVPFEQSLDFIGENRYGNVGEFPAGHGVGGLTCISRLREVFKLLIQERLQELLDKCHFSDDCPFNADTLQEKDERIYQSIEVSGKKIAGQRPVYDHRHDVLTRLLHVLAKQLGNQMHVVDIGSNLGTLSLTAGRSGSVARVTGLEAFAEYVKVSEILAFLSDQNKLHFAIHQAGSDPLPAEQIDLLLLFSVYHHIRNKDAFLQDLARNRPRAIIGEMAVQERYYDQRKGLDNELKHIANTLGYKTLQVLGYTSDYQRPICLFSDGPLFDQATLDAIMRPPQAAAIQPTPPLTCEPKRSYPVRVSIVLPTYNHARYLPAAVNGVIQQTFDDYELIIVDDGSTDDTAGILAAIQHPKVHVVTQSNHGLPAALNSGFERARGEYWTWTSADNIPARAWLEELVQALDEAPQDVGYALSSFALIDDRGQIISVDNRQCFEPWGMLVRNGNASFLYRSEIARRAGIYDTSLNGAEDLDMWLRMAVLTRAVRVESVLYYYRMHEASMTSRVPDKISDATRRAIDKFLDPSCGTFDVDRFFPGIRESANQELARWQARIWLAAHLVQGTHCQAGAIADLLFEAVEANYDPALVGNIVHVFAGRNMWESAAEAVSYYGSKRPSAFLERLSDIVTRKDATALQDIPFVTIADKDLSFDRKEQRSRAQMCA
jgi:glycosyltransferase involved in cell wall biosynthesis